MKRHPPSTHGKLVVLWPDGSLTSGETWSELERAIRASQWVTFESQRTFRAELRHRAEVYTGRRVQASGTPRQFLTALAKAGMFAVVRDDLTAV